MVNVKPQSVQKDVSLQWSYDSTIIECDTSSAWGVTIKGLKEGQTSLRCSYEGFDANCVVTVSGYSEGYSETVEPYIYSNTSIIQMAPGVSERVYVSLYGGNATDIDGYTWINDTPNVCSIQQTGQYCVITAKDSGYARIKITHTKAIYPYYIGVYVLSDPTNTTYITTQNNIVTLNQDSKSEEINVSLVNGKENSLDSQFNWEIVNDSTECPVEIAANGNSAVVTPKRGGSCTLRITHPDAAYPLEILCRVTTDEANFIKQLEGLDGINPLQMIDVGKTTPLMKALGINENPIKMEQSVVTKALREEIDYTDDKDLKGHSLTLEHIKRIPQALSDPIMVFKSRTRNDSYVFFTEQKDNTGRSIIIPVAVDKRYGRIKINKVTSIYGRSNEVDFVQSNITQGNLVYVDKKRSLDWERECKVQFLAQVLPSDASTSNILTKDKLVNFISSQNQSTVQKHAEPIEQNNITNQKENTMENNFNYMPDNEYFANWENMSDLEKQESSTARKEHFDVFVKAMKEQGISNQQELDDYIQNHINDDVNDANPWMKPYGENNLKNLVRARQDFIKAHPEIFRETQEQISELGNDEEITERQKTPSHPWKKDFGEVITNSNYQDMIDNRELQIKAKQGDVSAAAELVNKLVDTKVIENIAKKYPNAIIVPTPSMETLDKKPNALPFAYARKFEQYGMKINDDIVETKSAHHTGTKTFKRVVNRPSYDGSVEQGKDYIIVDDVFSMGGTVNSLRNFIEDKGGNVVAITTLTAGVDNIKTIAITDETLYNLNKLDEKGEILNAISKLDIAENYESLTEAFGQYVLKNSEKLLNEERSRRTKENSTSNDERTSKNNEIKFSNSTQSENQTTIQKHAVPIEPEHSQNDDFINALNESEQAINEATNGMGHDPTDGLPLDFDPPLTQEQMDMWSEIAETEGNTHSDEVFDMYETKDGKLFYPEEIVPPSVEESLKNVYPENEVDTTSKKVDAYASEIYSVLSNFSTANPADWNVDKATAVTLHHLAEVADIKKSEREESIEKIKEYFTTDEYAKEEESMGKTFSEIIKTKDENGYDFDFAKKWEETYFNTQNTPSLSEDINLLSRNEIGLKDEFITISNHTPYIFKNLKQHGFEDEKIAIYKDKLARGLFLPVTERHGHDNSLTKENVAETFENLANPRAILLSKDGKSLIGVYDVPDKKNEPMMVSFRPENGQIEVNLMTSIYGKPEKDIEHWIDNGQLLYVNDMEKEKAFTLPSRQLRISDINTSSLNIQTKSEIVNELTLDGKIEMPTFAMATKNGLRTCEHFKVESINKEQKKMTVSNDKGEKIVLDENTVKAIVTPEIDISNKKKNDIVWTGKKVPEFAMITQHGLQTFKDMTVEKYNAESKSWTLSNADGQSVNVTDLTLKELTSNQRIKQVQKFTNDTLARDKMLVTQYNDYFKQRDNTAYNFRHNLSVYCRKEANSPVDALKIASIIIKEMPVEERRKTKELLNTMRRDGETVNQVIANMYTEAVKDVPLNEAYIANNHHDKKIARPMYDTLSVKGEKIDRDFNLKIGDNISNMAFKMGKTFGIGKETLYQNCTIVSASKEGNVVTLMDGNKSYYDVPRDTFLKEYARQQKHEQKLENHQQRQHRYNMQMSVDY